MKKILYINQYFKHPGEPGITRSYWIAQKLIEAGFQVTMLAHKNVLLNQHTPVPRVERSTIDGIDVIYLRNRYSNNMGIIARARAFLTFMLSATYQALREKDVDLVIATSTPLTVAFPALICKLIKRTPFIFEVRDLWPEVPIQMGAIRNPLMQKLLRRFEKTTYVNAEHIVALSPGMQDGVCKFVPRENTSMIPNMAKIDQFWPRQPDTKLFHSLSLRPNSFKVIYFGQMGISNALDYIIAAAEFVHHLDQNIDFLFLGHGNKQEEIINISKRKQLTNIHVMDRVPMKKMSAIANLCHVSLVTFSDLPILYTNSPNKLFDSISAGLPVIVNSPGWTKDMVETHKCGFFSDPEKPEDLAKCILRLKNNLNLRREMGANARRLAETTYDKSILCRQFLDVVNMVWSQSVQGGK